MIEFAKKDKLSLKSCIGIAAVLSGYISFSMPVTAAQAENAKPVNKAWALPALILNDLNGKEHNLYEWRGKVIMLNFWATWCGPCQIEIPYFMKYQQHYAGQGLQIIGIGLDETQKLRNYARTLGINYPILRTGPEQHYALLNQWGDPSAVLPFTVIIDREGRLVFRQIGVFNDEAFETIVKPLLE
ncbi:TlpA family protein disulfide reductase [Methylobacter luteus]|uniref:TlpA family protein disulfide reductase n=1 Tax=Methylobacter luteus TaxID=415 RepID=UPI00042631F0|nr:TlpA disulfide reductase family protein [Methylobacter luteus]